MNGARTYANVIRRIYGLGPASDKAGAATTKAGPILMETGAGQKPAAPGQCATRTGRTLYPTDKEVKA